MRTLTLTLLVVTLLLSGACGTSLVAVPLPELDGVEEALGYGLAPTRLPEGFEFDQYVLQGFYESVFPSMLAPYANIPYKRFKDYAYHHIFIHYPWSFSLSGEDNFLFERLGPDWQRPDDAVSEVKVNGKPAYLVRGSWSAESLQKLENPEWDYDMYLSLYFDFELSPDEVVGVMIQAMLYPAEWITAKEMVKIAESIRCLD